MDKNYDDVSDTRVLESTSTDGVIGDCETLDENLDCGGEEGEIMVEVVGSDVFVDGVGGDLVGGNDSDLGVREAGDVDDREHEGGVGTGVEGSEEVTDDKAVDVVVKKDDVLVNEDVVMEEVDIVAKEDVKVVVREDDLEKCVELTERDGVSCMLKSANEDNDMHDDAMNCGSEDNAEDNTVVTGSSIGNSHVVAEQLTSLINEDVAEEAVKSSCEVHENQKTPQVGVLGDETSNAHVFKDKISSDESIETAKDEGTQTSGVHVSIIEHTQIVTGSTEALDNKVINSDKDSISGDSNILMTEIKGVVIENANCAVENERKIESLFESSKSDITPNLDLDSRGKQIPAVNDGESILNGSLLSNPLAEASTTKVERHETTCSDTGKDGEHVHTPGIEVSGVNFKEATNSEDKGSVADAPVGNLSCCATDDCLVVESETETVNNESKTDVAVGTNPVCSSEENHEGGTEETTVMRSKIKDSDVVVPATVMDVTSGCSEEVKCLNPVEKDGAVLINEENLDKQALVSEVEAVEGMDAEKASTSELNSLSSDKSFLTEDQQLKAVASSGNDILNGEDNIATNGIVVASADTAVTDEKVILKSKSAVLEGDTGHAEDIKLNSVIGSGSSGMDEEKKYETQKSDDKQSGTLIFEDDPDKILNRLPTDEILDKGDSHPALPQRIGEVTSGTQLVLSSDVLHGEGEAVHYRVTDIPSQMSDGNQNSDVKLISNDISLIQEDVREIYVPEEVTSNDVVDLVTESSHSEPLMDHLVENTGNYSTEEGKQSQGGRLDENISLPYELNSLDSNVQETEGDFDLQVPGYLDASSNGKFGGVSSDQDHIFEFEEEYNEEKEVDICIEQDMEVQVEGMEIEQLEVGDEKITEQMSPRSGSSIDDFHSQYLLPPRTEGEFSVSDLVWGKVRSHPWWPGQIFNPSDASEEAIKYHKKDCFLVAYFGDQTFAWNDASLLRPFRTHFGQIEKRSNSEGFHHAVSCALAEVYRRVELGLTCSCIPKNSFAKIESQIVENTGICQAAGRRYGVDESTAASCFEPEELLEHIRSLALFPSGGSYDRLQLLVSKGQLSAFSRFKGQRPLPEFQECEGLLEKDADTLLENLTQQHSEQVKVENYSSGKRNRDFTDSLLPRKKERSMSEFSSDMSDSSEGEDESDNNIENKAVASSSGRKRKEFDSVSDGSADKRQSYYAAKVSTTPPAPKPSFKVGESIRRVASQLTGSPSLVKCNSEKFLKVDDSVEQRPGFDDSLQTPVISQRGTVMLSPEHSSLDEMLSQLHLAAQDPMKGYSFLNNITTFFSDFRHSVALGQNSRMRNLSAGRGSRKKKVPQSVINSLEDFEFDDVNDSYWTDRIVQNYGEDQLLNSSQNGEAEYQLVPYETDKPLKSGRRSRKQFSSRDHAFVAEEPVAEHIDGRRQDCSPTELILNFSVGNYVPTELNLNKIFRRFGPLRECETEVDRETNRARVVYKRCSDAEVAFNSAGKFNIFGPMHVSYELSYVPSAAFKTLPVATLQGEQNASQII